MDVSSCGWRLSALKCDLNQTAVEGWASRMCAVKPARCPCFQCVQDPVEVRTIDVTSLKYAQQSRSVGAIERIAFEHLRELVLRHMVWSVTVVGMNEAPA